MEHTMTQQMKTLLSENLNLDLFYSINIGYNGTRLLAEYSEDLEKYLLKKSFQQKDCIYEDDSEKVEFENVDGSVRIVLMKD
jgi:hypothetical protein